MKTFRSEIQVPINKGNTEVRSSIDSNIGPMISKFSNPSIDQWCDKLRQQFQIDNKTFNCLTEDILSNQLSGNHVIGDNVFLNSENLFRQLQSQISKGKDGNMHFTAKFDIKNIDDPDKIRVFVKDTSLVMNVEYKEIVNSKCSTLHEYTRKFNLPPNIISDTINCTISIDNILILDGILDASFDQRKCSSSINLFSSSPYRSQSLVSSSSSSSLLHSPSSNDKYKISVHIGNHYNPQDISIKTRDDKIFINARHEEKSDSRTNYTEFSKEIQLPDRVDSLSLSAIFNNGNLTIEAPFNYN